MNNFRWSMTEDDYKRMQKMRKEKTVPSNNVFRGVAIGSLLFEWCGTEDYDDWDYYYVNCFEAGVDTGYGNLNDGTPYDCIDHYLPFVSTVLSFEEFKTAVEQKIIEMARIDYKFKQKIEADVEPKWYGF